MNLINKKLIKLGKVVYQKNKNSLIVENNSDSNGFLVVPRLYKYTEKSKRIIFKGKSIIGDAPLIKIINRRKTVMFEFGFNTENVLSTDNLKYFILAIYIPPHSKFEVSELCYDEETSSLIHSLKKGLKGDILLVTPGYPSESDKYNTAFVHTRVKEYLKAGMKVDVLQISSLSGISKYVFEGVEVIRGDYFFLREALSQHNYKNIIIHFFDHNYGNVLDSVDTSGSNIYLFAHGADVLYHYKDEYSRPYFESNCVTQISQTENFEVRDYYIKKYNNLPNVKWIFVSDFIRERLENALNIKVNNYTIIPNYIDDKLYTYVEKNEKLHKKVFVLRKFTNDYCYALDIDIRAILTLSRRECFKELEFDIYGSGEMFDRITAPVKNFENVHLHQTFLTHNEIREIHNTHGIALFASRFDTQGVSLCEAAASGCAVVTSNISTITSYINKDLGVTCEVENFVEYADAIEKLAYDPEYFKKVAITESNSVKEKFSYDQTIGKEISLIKNTPDRKLEFDEISNKPILSIIVPSYNVEKYLWNGVMSLVDQRNAHKMEVLIIDDGSKDKTAQIGKQIEAATLNGDKSIVRLISKENGGHGSTINVGILNARGKYTKIMDGDDTLDSYYLAELIDILEKEDSDIVLNNYIEDFASMNKFKYVEPYNFMLPGVKYRFEDLCYEGYGFSTWGPILACSSYRTEFLKNINFKLLEKCFYVDVELNTYVSLNCETITFYPLNIYRYLLGRNGQSISKESYMRNYKHHEKVTLKIMECLLKKEKEISSCRKEYVMNMLILKMITTQYIVTVQFYHSSKPFQEFEKGFKKYPEFYNDPRVATRAIKFHRATKGFFIFMNSFLVKIKNIIFR